MVKPFFPTFKEQWTKTPNIFFDEVLKTDGITLNEIRIVGFLIRNTLGYQRDAKWIGVSRKDLIDGAKVSNTRLTASLEKCKKHGWIIEFTKGEGTNKKRYIFLNDARNQAIVEGLEKGYFNVEDLEYLNEAGIERLLKKHGLSWEENTNTHSSPETGEEHTFFSRNGSMEQTFFSRNGSSSSPETGEADDPSAQAGQAVPQPLKKVFKEDDLYIKNDDDREPATPEVKPWEADQGYQQIRQMFVVNKETITSDAKVYKMYLEALKECDHQTLLVSLMEYIKRVVTGEHEHTIPQIAWFLNRGWKNFMHSPQKKEQPKKQQQPKLVRDKLPRAIQMQMEQPQQPANSEDLTEKQRKIHEKLREMNERFNARKEKQKNP